MSNVAFVAPQETLADRVQSLVESADYRRADSEDVREAIFRLRYEAYLAEGAIGPNPEERFTDSYDDLGNAWIFGIYLEDQLVSSIRIHVATQEFPDMPARSAFADYVDPELAAGKILIDPTRHVVERAAMQRHPNLVYLTLRLAWMSAEYFHADAVLAAVRREHQAFYRKTFNHRTVCEPRPYLMLQKPLGLMTMNYAAQRDRVNARYPFLRSSVFERRMLFERLQDAPAQQSKRPALRVLEGAKSG